MSRYTESMSDQELLKMADTYRATVESNDSPEFQAYLGATQESKSFINAHAAANVYFAALHSLELDCDNPQKKQLVDAAYTIIQADYQKFEVEDNRLRQIFDPEGYTRSENLKRLFHEDPHQWHIEFQKVLDKHLKRSVVQNVKHSVPNPEQTGIVGWLKQVAQKIGLSLGT